MKIVYYSIPPFADCDFPLIRELRRAGHDVYYIVRLAPFMCHATLFDIDRMDERNSLLPISAYPELARWGEYIDLGKSFVSNDTVGKTGLKSFRLFREEMKKIAEIGPDVVHHVGIPFVFHLMMMLRYRRKAVCVVHDPLPHSGESSMRDSLKRRALSCIRPKFILLNKRMDEAFCNRWNVPRSYVFHSSLGPYDAYRSFRTGRKIEGRYILLFGRLSPYKGIDYAIDAFLKICDRHPGVRFIIAGAGPLCFDAARAEESGRIDLIHRYLSLEEIADYVSQAQFVVCPYTDATQSGVAQTVLGLGTPIVATDTGNFRNVIDDGRTGIIVPPKDADALATAFDAFLSDNGNLSRMRNAVTPEESTGVWQLIADDYLAAYKAV